MFSVGPGSHAGQVPELTPTQKGNIAEMAVAWMATRLGYVVSRPMAEGSRYDLILDDGSGLMRVQCKSAVLKDGVVSIPCRTTRTTPAGYVRSTYSASEIDAVAAYCHALDTVYLIPVADVDGKTNLHLRVSPTRNNQSVRVKWATAYRLGL